MATLGWTGPFKISELLARCMDEDQPWPPAADAVYLVSRKPWSGAPDSDCAPLYVGGNTGSSSRFCTRIGDLVADMHGLWDGETGHHSGGQSLYRWCEEAGVHPGELYLAWATGEPWCGRCAEIDLMADLVGDWQHRDAVGLLNKHRLPACDAHARALG